MSKGLRIIEETLGILDDGSVGLLESLLLEIDYYKKRLVFQAETIDDLVQQANLLSNLSFSQKETIMKLEQENMELAQELHVMSGYTR